MLDVAVNPLPPAARLFADDGHGVRHVPQALRQVPREALLSQPFDARDWLFIAGMSTQHPKMVPAQKQYPGTAHG